ncbi:acyl-CoA carboxylase subunit epsilon, partial [Streptomyces fradiae]
MTTPLADPSLLRVEKGHAAPEELAALTAVILARANARPAAVPAHPCGGSVPTGFGKEIQRGGTTLPKEVPPPG